MINALLRPLRSLPRAWGVTRYFAPRMKPHVPALSGALGLGFLASLCNIARPWPVQMIFDHVLIPRADAPRPLGVDLGDFTTVQAVAIAGGLIVLVSIMGGYATFTQTMLLKEAGQRVVARIRRDLFRHFLKLPLSFHTRRRSGDLIMRLTGDIVLLRELVVGALHDGLGALTVLVGTLAVMAWLEPTLTLLSLTVIPAVVISGGAVANRIRSAVRKARLKEGALSGDAGEALGTIHVLQAYGAEGMMEERFSRQNRSGLRCGLKAARAEATLSRWLDLLTSVGGAVTLAFGAWSVAQSTLTPGGLLVFLAYQRSLYRPVRQLARTVARAAKASACGERVIEILETPIEVDDAADAVEAPRIGGAIELAGVTVRYPRGDVALNNVDLQVAAGETVVIRGRSGAGKSTLASLVPRLMDPSEGTVKIDGVDIREWTLESLRRQVAVVFQESVLLGVSLRENIALGCEDADPASIEKAARVAGVMEFADRLPDGLDTIVGERGAQLSGGQRQRVALARAALRDVPILVLDEPFAHLDESSRDYVLAALQELSFNRTVLMITHHDHPGLAPDLEVTIDAGNVTRLHWPARAEAARS